MIVHAVDRVKGSRVTCVSVGHSRHRCWCCWQTAMCQGCCVPSAFPNAEAHPHLRPGHNTDKSQRRLGVAVDSELHSISYNNPCNPTSGYCMGATESYAPSMLATQLDETCHSCQSICAAQIAGMYRSLHTNMRSTTAHQCWRWGACVQATIPSTPCCWAVVLAAVGDDTCLHRSWWPRPNLRPAPLEQSSGWICGCSIILDVSVFLFF